MGVAATAPAMRALTLRTEIRLPSGGAEETQYVTPGKKLTLTLPTGDATQTALGSPDFGGASVQLVEETLNGQYVRYDTAALSTVVATGEKSLTLTVPDRVRARGFAYSLRIRVPVAGLGRFERRTRITPRRAAEASRYGALVVDGKGRVKILLSRAVPRGSGSTASFQEVGVDKTLRFGRKGDIPFAGDWNGDGVATVGLYRPSSATWYLAGANTDGGGKVTVVPFGRAGDQPLIGAFGTDPERDSIGVLRAGRFHLANAPVPGTGARTVALGRAGDRPLYGDFDGDGAAELAVWRPSTRTAYTSPGPVVLGQPPDTVLAGDPFGRGWDDLGVHRPSTRGFTFVDDYYYWWRFGLDGADRGFVFTP